MSPSLPVRSLFELKSTAWYLTALRLHGADADALGAELDARFADSPGLFDDDPLVIDLSPLRESDVAIDFAAIVAHLRRHHLQPLAVQGGSPAQTAAARAAGLAEALEPESRPAPRPQPVAEPAPLVPDDRNERIDEAAAELAPDAAAEPVATAPVPVPTLVVDKPLRSGQRVYARGGDLVVLSVVSFGAEVIADGSIHVYAPLRGRAIAGARGDTQARIFSTCMEPQLVSIAGIYRTTETPLPADVSGRAAQVRLEGERILVEALQS